LVTGGDESLGQRGAKKPAPTREYYTTVRHETLFPLDALENTEPSFSV
jgi:hypothetical protein